MSNINLTSVNQGTLWHLNNIKTISGVAGNILTISGNTSLSVMNLGTNIDISGNLNANGNMIIPSGSTGNRPFGVQGYFRFNTTDSLLEFYTGSLWKNIISTTTNPTLTRTITIANASGSTLYTWNSSFATYTFNYNATLLTTNSTYTISVSTPSLAIFALSGAGGAGGQGNTIPGGSGGTASGIVPLYPNVTYCLIVGGGGISMAASSSAGPAVIGGGGLVGTLGYGGQGGGFTGLFYGSVTPGSATGTTVTPGINANALLIAGGGGGASWEQSPGTPSGGNGGGFIAGNGQNMSTNPTPSHGGGGATWAGLGSYIGAGGTANGPTFAPAPAVPSLAGVILQGGGCANSGDSGGGGGGGGGYYGGGAGSGENPGSGGGGGSGFISSIVFSATTTTGGGGAGGTGGPAPSGAGANGSATIAFYA